MIQTPSYNFPPHLRIRRRAEYDGVFKAGQGLMAKSFRVVIAPSGRAESRVGVIVSKKVGNAHQRNRVKRLVREFFRLNRHGFAKTLDMVVIAKPGAKDLDLHQAQAQLLGVLEKWLAN